MWHVSESLPPRRRYASDAAIAALLAAGACTAGWSQPVWLQVLARAGAAAVTATAQALALHSPHVRSVTAGS